MVSSPALKPGSLMGLFPSGCCVCILTGLSGTLHLGMGDTLDTTKGMTLPAGAVGYMPPKMRHFAWAGGETLIQVHGSGPEPSAREPHMRSAPPTSPRPARTSPGWW